MFRLRSLLLIFCLVAPSAHAGEIGNACLKSDRGRGQRSLCTCIQKVADQTLNRRDQRLAARFFKDPERAQAIRLSSSRQHERFWERYERFGQTSEKYCRR